MLAIAQRQQLHGHEVFGDTNQPHTFYVLPKEPRFRLDDNGKPVFKFVKYRFPVDRPDGRKGGGRVMFDVAFYVPADTLKEIRKQLESQLVAAGVAAPNIVLATPQYTGGKANLLLKNEDGTLIQGVMGVTEPSGYGDNIASYQVELTQEGATLFEQTMKGEGPGGVIVQYELPVVTALPPLKARAWFHGHAFAEFFQSVKVEDRFWFFGDDTYREQIRDRCYESNTMGVSIDVPFVLPGDPEGTRKLTDSIRTSMQASLEQEVARLAFKAGEAATAEQRKTPGGFDEIVRHFTNTRDVRVERSYEERSVIEWIIKPNGNLPNITTMKGPDGQPFAWKDYYVEVDLNDPLFRQLEVSVGVNADFANLPLHSVEVHLDYAEGKTRLAKEFMFKDADAREKFVTFIENDSSEYEWRYQVNYKGSGKGFTSETKTTDERVLTINVDDLGLLNVTFEAGAIDWEQVKAAQIAYEYKGAGGTVSDTLTLTEANPVARVVERIEGLRDRPLAYTVTYQMADGREHVASPIESMRRHVVVNDVFGTKLIPIRVAGDLSFDPSDDPAKVIDEILLDIAYHDGDGLSKSTNVVLSAEQPFHDWEIPVIGDGGGEVRYSGQVKYHNGTTVPIAETVAQQATILVGNVVASRSTVEVMTDLIDFTEVKLVRVTVAHGDESKSFVLKQAGPTSATMELAAALKGPISYHWSATFHLVDGTKRTAEGDTSDQMLLLELPAVDSPAQPIG